MRAREVRRRSSPGGEERRSGAFDRRIAGLKLDARYPAQARATRSPCRLPALTNQGRDLAELLRSGSFTVVVLSGGGDESAPHSSRREAVTPPIAISPRADRRACPRAGGSG